jgi:hypothetical protein
MKITTAAPGSAQGLYLIVSDIEAARKDLVALSVEVSEVFHASNRAPNSVPKATAGSVGRTPVTVATFPLLRSATQMATPGCSRRYAPALTWTQQFGRLDADRAFA